MSIEAFRNISLFLFCPMYDGPNDICSTFLSVRSCHAHGAALLGVALSEAADPIDACQIEIEFIYTLP